MYRQPRLHLFALYAAIIALLALAFVPPVMQVLRPAVLMADAMPGCNDPTMLQMHHPASSADHNGDMDSCLMCSLACHVPTLAAMPPVAWVAPLGLALVLQPVWRIFSSRDSLFTPPARGPPSLL
ncbi:DUF2946 family protein [Silvimonas soli]|uniref:DUF2946 family protein n=1 Tax=Silvimonas soli TaxID=2980100 RepID=UPI0024B321B7|nr:DUF2946 family protein [Silvimonas soli]